MGEHPLEPVELERDPDLPPRPEEDAADAQRQPIVGGLDAGEPVQGQGEPDSY